MSYTLNNLRTQTAFKYPEDDTTFMLLKLPEDTVHLGLVLWECQAAIHLYMGNYSVLGQGCWETRTGCTEETGAVRYHPVQIGTT